MGLRIVGNALQTYSCKKCLMTELNIVNFIKQTTYILMYKVHSKGKDFISHHDCAQANTQRFFYSINVMTERK